jgi:pilus assembly protein CpaC
MRLRSRHLQRLLGAIAACAMGLCFAGIVTPVAAAASSNGHTQEIVIGVGKSRLVNLPAPYADVMIADPKIADILPLNRRSIYVVGKSLGSTALTVYGAGRHVILSADVDVSADLEGLQSRLHQVLPNETHVSVSPANQSIVLSGTVSSPAALQQIVTLADSYDTGKVVNMLTVEGTQEIMLSVRFVEMERTTAKDLKLNITQSATSGHSPQVSVQSGQTLLQEAANAVSGASLLSPTSTFGIASLAWKVGGGDLSVLFDALETKGLIKTLAEPTLVTTSGDTANFLAGGEFPIPVAQSSSGLSGQLPTISVEFKQFGISLAFTPTLLQDGLMNMVVNPEVSSIDPTTSINLGQVVIPGIKIRRAHTTVELRDGESFTIAGLLSDNYQNDISQFPFVGDIPVIGALFRSTSYQRDQTELVILVTPHLVTPTRVAGATPADRFVPPSDFELFLFGAQRGKAEDLKPEDRALMSLDPGKGGVDGPYGHVLY